MTTEHHKKGFPLVAGQIFGRLKIKGEAPAKTFPSGNKTARMVYARCMCGEECTVDLNKIRSGHTKSCGCYQREVTSKTFTKHGGCKDRLYTCWEGMLRRSKRRGCEVFHEWREYGGFRDWALSSGYEENLVLCRNGDVGDYTPTNARWDTSANNTIEAHALCYEVSYPDGHTEVIMNMSEFCRNNGLSQSSACLVSNGKYKQHKGYKFRRIDGDKHNTLSNTLSEACSKEGA